MSDKVLDKERLKNIKLIALDLDGTTLTRNGLTRRTKETLEEAIRRGIKVVIATGRPYVALPEKVLQIQGLEYVIISNGAHIANPETGEFLYSNYMSEKAAMKVRSILMETKYEVEVFTAGKAFIDKKLYDDLAENGSTYMGAKYILRTRQPVENIYDFWEETKSEIENINIHFEFLEDRANMYEVLSQVDDAAITSSMPHNIEVGGATTSKASALCELCRITGVDMENVIAFGDSHNDMAMIKEAGIGVAMGNAEEDVKEIADHIAPSNDEEGVAYTIRTLIFGEKNGMPEKKKRRWKFWQGLRGL